ncbi:hypothetical protein ACT7DO_28880 [Bacillus pacificus]
MGEFENKIQNPKRKVNKGEMYYFSKKEHNELKKCLGKSTGCQYEVKEESQDDDSSVNNSKFIKWMWFWGDEDRV